MGVRCLISGTESKGLTGVKGVENLANRFDPMETVCPGKSQLDSLEVSSVET